MKKLTKLLFAGALALSLAPSIAISMTTNKEEVVSVEDETVLAQNVYYFEGSSSSADKKDFRNAPEGYTFDNGVITVTSAATVDYSIYVDDITDKGNLTVVFERDYGDGTIYIAGNGGEITLTSSIDVTVTLATIRNENSGVTIRGNVYLNIVGPEDRNILFNVLVYAGHDFSICDNASFVCVDPKLYEKQFDKSYRLIFVDHFLNIKTTGCFRVGIFDTGSEDTCPIIIYFGQKSSLFNPNECNGGAVIYTRFDPNKMYPASAYSTAYSQYKVINEEDGNREIYIFRKCIISYNSNGGTGEMKSIEEYKHVSSYKLPSCTFTAPAGKQFKCWAKNKVTGTEYNVGDSYDIDDDVTFYAIWEDLPAAALAGTVSITGSLKYGKTLTAEVTDTNNTGALSYQWRRNGEQIGGATSSTYLVTENDIGHTLSVAVTSSVETGSIVGTASGSIGKADGPAAPTGITATACTTEANDDGVLKGVTAEMEYKLSASSGWADGTGSDIANLVSGIYNVRYKETDTHEAGEIANVVVNAHNAPVLYSVTVNKGAANPIAAVAWTVITIAADAPEDGYAFDKWVSEDGVVFADANSTTTTFSMPEKNVTVTATYKPAVVPPTPTPAPSNSGLGGGAIAGIVIGSVLVAGIAGFALVWFVIKKKTWADFLALFKKK
ncbi:MAG: InlB B-repeat-containing protein [Bacilli bacterium]|nr:InlB B-repeat-containing protein [Bacilli bacterium]